MNTRHTTLAAAFAASLMLGACNGNGAATPPVAQDPAEVPTSAMATTQALVDWAGAQPASESLDPLSVVKAMPPVSDSDEPAAIR